MRRAQIDRRTNETDIHISLNLDGRGISQINTGVGFFDHMLTSFAKHSRFDLEISCAGDTYVDDHHSVEDVGIALGQAFYDALGDRKGITRFGDTALCMDEALVLSAVDISGRANLTYNIEGLSEKVGSFDTELVREFFLGFVRSAQITLHIHKLAGENSHHMLEACFKSCARSLKQAVSIDEAYSNEIPSTKGAL